MSTADGRRRGIASVCSVLDPVMHPQSRPRAINWPIRPGIFWKKANCFAKVTDTVTLSIVTDRSRALSAGIADRATVAIRGR